MSDSESLTAIIATLGVVILVIGLISLIVGIICIVAAWKYFKKAGKPGWACIIPYYNTYVQCEIGGTKVMWFVISIAGSLVGAGLSSLGGDDPNAIISLLSFACSVMSIVASIIIMHNVFKSFGYGAGMTVLFIFFPIIPILILGFGKCAYLGPQGSGNVTANQVSTPTAANAPPEMGKACPNCGHALQPGESFCTNCGAKS